MYFCTPRCFIRDFRIEDIPTVMTYRNDLEWMKYQGFKNRKKLRISKNCCIQKVFLKAKI